MKKRDGVYYDAKRDYLVLLMWIGNKFYIDAKFDDLHLTGISRKNAYPKRAGLIYIGKF